MNNRLRKTRGFTLAELLIVVTIIGVLVAVSIPIFTGQLEKSRIATDKANVRSAKAAATAQYLTDGAFETRTYYYTGEGTIVDETQKDSIKGYGKSNVQDNDASITGAFGTPKNGYVSVTVQLDGSISAFWNSAGKGSEGAAGLDNQHQQLVSSLIESKKKSQSETEIQGVLVDIRSKGAHLNEYTSYYEDNKVYIAKEYVYFSKSNATTLAEAVDTLSTDKKSKSLIIIDNKNADVSIKDYEKEIKITSGIVKKGTIVYYAGTYYYTRGDNVSTDTVPRDDNQNYRKITSDK